MIYILCFFVWIVIGWCVCYWIDDSKLFIDWLNEDPTGFVNIILMGVWPIFAIIMIKNKRRGE